MAASALSRDQFDLARPAGVCALSGRAFAPDEKFMAALRETADGFQRLDIAAEQWDAFDKSNLLASWQTALPKPQEKKKLLVDDQVLRDLFERLGETDEPTKLNFRFVLGLILMRKRMLVYESTEMRDEREWWIVRLRGQDQPLQLLNPKLTEPQVAEVSQQMSQIINEEL